LLTLAVTYAGVLGGAERTLLSFARALPGEVVLACPGGALADRARSEGLTVFALPTRALELRGGAAASLRAVGGLAGHAVEVRRLSEALHPDLVLAWGMRSAIAAAGARTGLARRPALLVRHVDFLPGPLVARAVRAGAARADRVSVNSQAVARDLDPRAKLGERLSVAHPGVDLDSYPHAWNVGSEPEALLLGALVPWKRPDLALEAVALASRELPELRLTVAGAPMGDTGHRLREALRRRAAEPDLAGRVRFVGELADPREALARAWCLLHCADREPFGSVLIQALAGGRPVVAPAAGGPAEIVDESCGRLYSPGSAQAAADALVAVLSSEEQARALGEAGRVRAARFGLSEARQRFAQQAQEAMAGAIVPPAEPPAGAGLALVTVTHNSASVVPRLLSSAQRHLPGARLIVVDSGSGDDSVEVARAAQASVTVLELGENVGFGKASNAGVAQVAEPICALVNPDVELVDDSLQTLAREVMAPDAPERILAPLVLFPDGRRQDTAHPEPGSPPLFLKALLPAAILPPFLRPWVEPWRSRRPRAVGWAVGCCLVAPTATLRRLGPFDERIFLFGEDMDLGLRAALQGVETWFCPDARVLHLDAHSTRPAFCGEPFDLLARQRRAVAGERLGPRAARRDHLVWLLTYADRIALKALARRPNARERRQLAAQWRARKSAAALEISEPPDHR
jgi:GT2 family glycosyltransferase/glycosyltransferase involved in cell wall biosynthesis